MQKTHVSWKRIKDKWKMTTCREGDAVERRDEGWRGRGWEG